MSDILTPLILDFLAWLEATPRPYAEADGCLADLLPRLTIWEDALDAGLVAHLRAPGALGNGRRYGQGTQSAGGPQQRGGLIGWHPGIGI